MQQVPRSCHRGPPPARTLVLLLAFAGSTARAQTAAEVAAANNPLARVNAVNLANYYSPSIYGAPNATANAFLLQPVFARPRMVFRVTLPLLTFSGAGVSESGTGDLNIFGACLLPPGGRTEVGVGPIVVFPTAPGEALGAGKWQAGVTGVIVAQPSPTFLLGGALSCTHSFTNGDSVERATVSVLAFRPSLVAHIGGGWYLRSRGSGASTSRGASGVFPSALGRGGSCAPRTRFSTSSSSPSSPCCAAASARRHFSSLRA